MSGYFRLCPACKTLVSQKENDGQYCEECGAQLLSKCPKCDKAILSGTAKFCRFCGINYLSPPPKP